MVNTARFSSALLALLLSVLALAAAYTLPLGRSSTWVFRQTAGPQQLVSLRLNTPLVQTFTAQPGTYSGVALYSPASRISDQKFVVRLLDSDDRELAVSSRADESYYLDNLRLQFPFPHQLLVVHEKYQLSIEQVSGSPFSLAGIENTAYSHDALAVNGESVPAVDLVMQLVQPVSVSAGAKQGVIAGLIFLWGAVLLQYIPAQPSRLRWLAASLLLAISAPLALAGYWLSKEPLGINDWDYYFSLHHIWREIIIKYHQLPFWNPYTCGGTAGLGDPEFSVFTPTFLLELIFGVPSGLRLAAFVSVAVGSVGMLYLAKRLRLSVWAALVAALAAFFGSVNILEITEGHPNVFASMWIPWIFWAWLGAYRKPSSLPMRQYLLQTLPCGIFLALTFYQGGIYLLMYTLIAFIVLPLLVARPWQAIKVTFFAGLWALGLAAIKLVPVLLWLRQFPDKAYASSSYTLPWLHEILLGRHLHGTVIIPAQAAGWHEYGAYIGYAVLGLAILGLAKFRQRRAVRALIIAALLAILLSSAGPLLRPLFDQAPFLPRSMVSRIIFFGIIPLALLAGFGLDIVRTRLRYGTVLAALLLGLVAVDLMSFSYQLSEQAFVVPDGTVSLTPSPYPLAFTGKTPEIQLENGETYTRAYLAAKAGYGTLNYCSVLGPSSQVKIIENESGAPFADVQDGQGSASLISWRPNHVEVQADLAQNAKVVINNNYARGWSVNKEPAAEVAGLIGARLPAGTHRLVFEYHTPGFIAGGVITLVALVSAAWLVARRHRYAA